MKDNTNRRKFLKRVGLAGGALLAAPAIGLAEEGKTFTYLKRREFLGTNENVNIALIGAGGMGTQDANTSLKHKGTKLVAVCDLYKGRLTEAKERWGDHLFLTTDYKEVLNRKDVDAIIIGTGDHWHKCKKWS